MRNAFTLMILGLLGGALEVGCAPPPPRVPVPAQGNQAALQGAEPVKPLPDQTPYMEQAAAPPFNDEPLVSQRPPEERAFVDVYRQVGQPKIAIFVNRTLEGQVLPAVAEDPAVSARYTRQGQGPEYRENVAVYLRPGEYDDVNARSLDYEAMENILTDWIACHGQVVVMSPLLVRQHLTDEQVKELQSGRPQVMRDIAQQLDADILIQVQAHPTKQTPQGLQVRVIAEAMNVRGAQSLGRAVVDVPPPLEKTQINTYTRFLARKLMDDMTQSWMAPPLPGPGGNIPPPGQQPGQPPQTQGQSAPSPAPAPMVPMQTPPAPPNQPGQPQAQPPAPMVPMQPAPAAPTAPLEQPAPPATQR